MNILRVEGLTKKFGSKKVIDDISFEVKENSVFGFIGKNGAGKTTTMKMILGLLKPDGGTISVCGERVTYGQTKTNRHIGYLPDVPEFYAYMKPYEYLRLCGEITGLSNSHINKKSRELLEIVGLSDANKRIGSFSRGMKQRLGIAQALLNEPRLLICDEPTSALDPIGRKEILDILSLVKGSSTVVFSTHILSDVERICDSVALINEGKLALSGTLRDIKSMYKTESLALEFASDEDAELFVRASGTGGFPGAAVRKASGVVVNSTNIKETETFVISILHKEKLLPLKLEVAEPTLENLFMEAVK